MPDGINFSAGISLAEAAIALGVPVFPCDAQKRPLTEHGFKDASADAAAIRRMFADPRAVMIGMPTGQITGIVGVDIDMKPGQQGGAWLDANSHRMPQTRTIRTGSGGLHLYFKWPNQRVKNSTSKIAPNIDVRGDGGYVIVPPSVGYAIADNADIADIPDWLLPAICPPEPILAPPEPRAPREASHPRQDGGSALGRAALAERCDEIRNAYDGSKHSTINESAFAVGGLVSAGEIEEANAWAELKDALTTILPQCKDKRAAAKTLRRAFADGLAKPQSPAPRAGSAKAMSRPQSPGPRSRSAKAMSCAARIKGGGGTFEQFVEALDLDAATKEWKAEKGIANGGRELRRTWDNCNANLDGVELTEDGVALAFEAEHKEALRFCHDTGGWYLWTGSHWKQNRDKIAFSWARALVRQLNRDAEFKTKAITGKASFAAAVEKYAQADRAFAVTAETWDRDLHLVGTPGGTVDLRTGELRLANRADHITKIVAVAPTTTADCPTWLAFLAQSTADDKELIRFLQQWAGYSLSGSIREHALLFIYGPGGNGKSVFLNTLAGILADYVASAAMDTFTSSPGDKHPTDLAMLRGARLVTATETEEGRAWAEARIKQMTGGDPVTARFMRQDFFTYTPQFKLTIAGNHKPALKNVDDAARRRFNIVPFLHKPEAPDHRLEHKLKAEWPGILRWMIDGCLDWQKHGLVRPEIVTSATAEYFEAQDTIGRWLAERCILEPHLQVKPGLLLADCRTWAGENGETPPTPQQFRSAMEKVRGARYATVKGVQQIKGVGLQAEPDARQGGEGGGGWR